MRRHYKKYICNTVILNKKLIELIEGVTSSIEITNKERN